MLLLQNEDLEELVPVGIGGFGVVRRARSRALGMEIALKTLNADIGSSWEDLKKEKELMHSANHTYVLRLLGTYEKKVGDLIEFGLVMEFMPYGSLYSLFDKVKEVPWALRFQIIHQVALGMNYLHRLDPPIIHRDLKPSNILLNKSLDVQITDFGLAKYAGTSMSSASTVGTVSYMPPEAFKETYKPTKMFDVYSFGILTWSVVSGQEPYPDVGRSLIASLIPNGSRPNMKQIDQSLNVKMVPEAKELMVRCWNGIATARPAFHECLKETASMFRVYESEIESAVQQVKDLLKEYSSSAQATRDVKVCDEIYSPPPVSSTVDSSILLRVFKERLNPEVHKMSSNLNVDREKTSAVGKTSLIPEILNVVEFLTQNLVAIVNANLNMDSILDGLCSVQILSREERNFIESSRTKEEQVRQTLFMVQNKGRRSSLKFLQLVEETNYQLLESLIAKKK